MKKVTLIDKWVYACDENFLHSFAFHSKTINIKVGENTEKYKETYNCSQPSNNQIYYCFLKAIVGTKDAISSQKIHCQGKLGSVFPYRQHGATPLRRHTVYVQMWCNASIGWPCYLTEPSLVDPHSSLADRRKLPV